MDGGEMVLLAALSACVWACIHEEGGMQPPQGKLKSTCHVTRRSISRFGSVRSWIGSLRALSSSGLSFQASALSKLQSRSIIPCNALKLSESPTPSSLDDTTSSQSDMDPSSTPFSPLASTSRLLQPRLLLKACHRSNCMVLPQIPKKLEPGSPIGPRHLQNATHP